jgi:ABC-type dipeptide/oligopeptide/nickel transport system permease subunit
MRAFIYMIAVCVIYFIVGIILIANHIDPSYAQVGFVVALSFPIWMPSFGRYLWMDIDWDHRLKRRFFKKDEKMNDNVYNLPTPKLVPPMPQVPLTATKQNYSVGTDANGNTILTIYSDGIRSSLTMNEPAVLRLIKMLEASIED